MGDILPFRPALKKKRNQGKTLCQNGFHKWAIDQSRQFDVTQGRLITVRRCSRCGFTKTTLA